MFDDIKCDAQLPDDRLPTGTWCQTKSLASCMERFTITTEGRLVRHRYRSELIGEREIRPGIIMPKYRSIPVGDTDLEYHGDIRFYGSLADGPLVDYVARFTHGALEWIRPYDDLSDMRKGWLD